VTPFELLSYLEQLGIESTTVDHDAVFTVDESRALRGDIPGAHTKALFLRSRDGRLWLFVTLADRRPDLKHLSDVLRGGRLSFGSPELLSRHLAVKPGAVTPLAVIHDPERLVAVVVDSRLLGFEQLNFHPLDNTKTTTISPDGLLRFLEAVDHSPVITDVSYL
jgi:Ala-tRNA(Pro) deacylase